ncbi:glutathione S-transferase family protein [Methylobacterium oryzisoli]|uniref:glutathione S-transferase family protein n=1 Tax=Methylobacterium oryzisoli TaxID=3385502 RepID=UPI003891DDEA
MNLYYSPGACSIGIHVLLEEIGKPYEPRKVSLKDGEQYKPEFLAINPKAKVPTLVRDDGTVLTEFPAIATWLALTNREKQLLPDSPEAIARVLEALDYIVATIHMQGFSRIFRPGNFAPNEADHEAVKAKGREIFEKGLGVMNKALEGRDYVVDSFSIADVALFYVEFWGAERLKMALPANCAAHYARMKARPAVQKVLQAEGFGT